MKIKYSAIAGALLLSGSGLFAATAEENATAYAEARSRISPIIVNLNPSNNVKQCGFSAGEDYNITFKTMGYEEKMDTYLTFYDCQDKDNANFRCGRRYDSPEKVVETEWISTEIAEHEDWTYRDAAGTVVPAYVHTYVAYFEMNATGADGQSWSENDNGTGGDIAVVRWWQKSTSVDAISKSVSLLIGVEATRHYGHNMRRVGTKVSNDLNASTDNTNCSNNN